MSNLKRYYYLVRRYHTMQGYAFHCIIGYEGNLIFDDFRDYIMQWIFHLVPIFIFGYVTFFTNNIAAKVFAFPIFCMFLGEVILAVLYVLKNGVFVIYDENDWNI